MTRFARRGTLTTKKPLEASSWADLKKGWQSCSRCPQGGHSPGGCPKDADSQPSHSKSSPADAGKDGRNKTKLEVKRQRRREEKKMKRLRMKERSKVCGFCQDIGHQTSDCPCKITDTSSFGACTKCGSADHASDQCKGPSAKDGPCSTCDQPGHVEEECPEASSEDEQSDTPSEPCPLCLELGHEVKGCPDNPRSIYPMGGCCKECGSVEHKSKHCPDIQPIKVEELTLNTRTFGSLESADAEDEQSDAGNNTKTTKHHRKKPKVVVF